MINKVRLILLIIITVTMKGLTVEKLYQTIPKEIMGWKAEEKDEFYDRETLYEYINGGAELYLTYDFKQAFARRFVKPNAPEIILEIYEMNSSKDAFGVFSSERQDEEVGIGQDSEYGGGLLRFWKDKYFVSILVIGDEKVAKAAILELGERVADVIPSIGKKPEIIKCLPKENLVENKIRFFHTHSILNRQYFLASENILNLNRQTDCVIAPYQIGKQKSYLLLLQYETQSKAEAAYQSFLQNYMPEPSESGVAKMENDKWTMAKLRQELLMIVVEASDEKWVSQLLSTVKFE